MNILQYIKADWLHSLSYGVRHPAWLVLTPALVQGHRLPLKKKTSLGKTVFDNREDVNVTDIRVKQHLSSSWSFWVPKKNQKGQHACTDTL